MYKIYTDGGARGNPGPAAAAFIVLDDKGRIVYKQSNFLGIATNNQAEYKAVFLAFNWLIKNKDKIKSKEITFFLDSELVLKQLSGIYRIKNKNIYVFVSKIKQIEGKLGLKVFYKKIPRGKNVLADKLVNLEIDKNTF